MDWAPADLILRKVTHAQVDSYSAFRENHGPDGRRPSTGLASWLRAPGLFCFIFVRDIWVLWSALDAVAEGFGVQVLWELTRLVWAEGDGPTRAALERAGIAIL